MIIATCGKYELIKDERGVYFFCECGCWVSCGYCKNDTEAIRHFAFKFNIPIEHMTVLCYNK
jgi:hypothetical protein